MGVRTSWLMLARNSLLARLAALASSIAAASCAVRVVTRPSRFSWYSFRSRTFPSMVAAMPLKVSANWLSSSLPASRQRVS